MSVYTYMSIKWGWIFLVRGKEVIKNWKLEKLYGFMQQKIEEKNPQMVSPLDHFQGKN